MSAPIWNEQFELPDRSHPANIGLDEDVIKTNKPYVFKTSWRRPGQDRYIRLGQMSSRRLQDVFNAFARRLQDVLKTSSRRLQDIFKTSCKDIFKTFSRRTIRLNCLPRSHLWEIYGQCRKFVSVLKFIKFYHNSMVLVFHFTGT